MVRPGLFVLVDPPNDGVLVPPRDDRVEQSVADRGQIVLSEAAAKQIVGVVRQCQIGTQPVGSDGACLIVVVGEEHRLLGKQQRACAEHRPGLARVIGCDEVGMGTAGTRCR